MTIATVGRRFTFAGNGITTAFTFPRTVVDTTYLTVYLTDNVTGVEALQTLIANYTVSGTLGDPAGVTVNFLIPPPTGKTVVVIGTTPLTQVYDATAVGFVTALGGEDAWDRAEMQIQELADKIARAILMSPGAIYSGTFQLPKPIANYFLAFNALGNGLTAVASSAGDVGPAGPQGPQGVPGPPGPTNSDQSFTLRNVGGTAAAITAQTGFALTVLTANQMYRFKPASNSVDGGTTIALDGIAPVPLRSPTGNALTADDIHTGFYYDAVAVGSPVTEIRICRF